MVCPSSLPWKRVRSGVLGAAGATAGSAAYAWFYFQHACKKPELYHHEHSKLKSLVEEHCKSLQKPYRPTPWLVFANAQTIFGAMVRGVLLLGSYHRQELKCEDGGTIALDWWRDCYNNPDLPALAPIVLVLHGINGDSGEAYCKWMCETAVKRGWRAAVLNLRGQGGLELTTPKTYCATVYDDVKTAVDSIISGFPGAPLAAVGYSLGSKLLTKYCAVYDNHPEGSKLKCAVMISNPFCFTSLARKFETPFTMGWLYNLYLTAVIKLQSARHHGVLGSQHLGTVNECWSVRHFDETIICEMFGYRNVNEYYQDASSVNNIGKLKTPSLFLVSKDDPFLGRLPLPEVEENPNTLLAVTDRGGHVAFVQHMWPFSEAWMDNVAAEFLTPHLEPPHSRL